MRGSSSLLGWPLLCLYSASAHTTLFNRDAVTVTVYATASTSAPSESYTTGPALIESTLNSTNHFRDQHNATPLTWNTSLADAASSWASRCQWRHSRGPTGENLALGYPDMSTAIDAWGNERAQYDFSAPTGFSEETGHFTQLVWKDTTSLGCAAVDCSGKNSLQGYVVVCEYWPPGNVVGQDNAYFRANVQRQFRAERRRSSDSTLQAPTTSSGSIQAIATATVIQAATSTDFVATFTHGRSTALGLGDEAAAQQLEAKSRGRLTLGVAIAAVAIAGAIG